MKITRRIISIMLTLVMVVSAVTAVPLTVNAEESNGMNSATDDLQVSGTNSLGNMLADEYAESAEADSMQDTGCRIYELAVEDKTVYADLQTRVDALLVVGVYDDLGQQMYTSARLEVTPDDTIVQVDFDTDIMPETFLLKAYLLDKTTNNPLCKAFECDTYTAKMQEFFSKTTEDFDEDRVLNLDEDNTNNFLVYNDNVILTYGTADTNVVTMADSEINTYVFENIDKSISSLKEGDVFSHSYGDYNEGLVILKIKSITIEGAVATICGDEMGLSDIFDYVKIDISEGVVDPEVDNSNLEEGVEFIGMENGEDQGDIASVGATLIDEETDEFKTALKYKLLNYELGEDMKITGSLSHTFGIKISCFYDAKFLQKDEVEFTFTLNYGIDFNVTLNIDIAEKKIELGEISYMPVAGIEISFTPSIVFEGKIDMTLDGVLTGQFGKQFKYGEWSNLDRDSKFDSEFKVELKFFVGLSLEPKISILGPVIEASVVAKGGVEAVASYTQDILNVNPREKHPCESCIKGELYVKLELKFVLSLVDVKALTWEAKVIDKKWKIDDFYYSIDKKEYGDGSCPYKVYRQVLTVVDVDGNIIEGAKVNDLTTNSRGWVIIYMEKGTHTITVSDGNLKKTFDHKVKSDNVIRLTLDEEPVGVIDKDSLVDGQQPIVEIMGECGDNAYYELLEEGTLVISGTGDMWDWQDPESERPSWYPYRDSINTIIIQDGITGIGGYAFTGCNITSVTIPFGVTKIGYYAFHGCNLTRVTIPSNVKVIEVSAFRLCDELVSVEISEGVTKIDEAAFEYCDKLTNLTIPSTVKTIGRNAFNRCSSLTSVIIPEGVEIIGGNAFAYCRSLTSVVIPEGVESIGIFAFDNCEALTSVTLPMSIREIDRAVFNQCDKLTDVYYAGSESDWKKIDIAPVNDELKNATMHYNYTSDDVASVASVGASADVVEEIVALGEGATKIYTRNNLAPGTEAVLVIMEGLSGVCSVDTSPILYIAQATVDSDGIATFTSYGDFSDKYWAAMVYGQCGHSACEWETIFDATESEVGLEACICKICGEVVESKDIPSSTAPSNPMQVLLGDANLDGKVNVKDATHIQKAVADLLVLDEIGALAADVDGNGKVNVKDATAIQKWVADIETGLPIGKEKTA